MKKTTLNAVIIISIIITLSCVSIIGAIFYSNENDIVLGILITDNNIPVGDNITLHYEIKNGMFAHSVSDVDLHIWVYDLRDTHFQEGLLHYFIPIDGLNSERIKDSVIISAHYLNPGEYLVSATMNYRTNMNHYKYMETEFEIYSEGD